jgi:tetratricopeptide (TPR) repeat protein/predicted Ser/Thr protein kinase
MIGTLINDRYRIDAERGQGGMGIVYRGHDIALDRHIAIKLLSKTGLGTQGRSRLISEAQMVAKLNHPNIVTVYDVGETSGAPFIVMEFVEGQTLHERRPAKIADIVAITRQVCAALEHAHESGIVHRDLKPENVFITPEGTVKLMDFGLARSVASRFTSEGVVMGTVFYLAPEQALGEGIDQRTDLYSLGVMLYELTTGQLPFFDDDPVAVISQHLHAPVVPPRAKNPETPPALNNLIVRLLSKNPAERPASAVEVLQYLEKPDVLDMDAPDEEQLSLLDRIVRGRLVGREQEVKNAITMWHKASSAQGQTLLISGEPGIGKTRLLREIAAHAEVSGGQAFMGTCYAEGSAPYTAFEQIIRKALQRNADNGFQIADFVMADLLTLSPSLRSAYPNVPPNPTMDPQSEQQRLFENLVAFCKLLSERTPILLAVDDIHWADSGTLSMLRHLARRTRRQRVLLLGTYREIELDEARPFNQVLLDLNRERLATRLKLRRLSREQTRQMLAALFAEEITPEFLDGIYHETEGNPYFIEEVCKALVESGKLYFEGGRWHRPSMEELEIPQSIRIAIQSRIGKLPEQVQEILQLASILGREFDFDTLAEASELDEDALIEALENAEQDQLIEEVSSENGVTFAFAHALVPATLAEGLRTLRRRRIHRRIASAIERIHVEDYEALAYHNGEAGDHEKALKYYTLAGERAAKAYANQEAEVYFRSALDLARIESEQAHLYAQLGEVLFNQSHFEDAIEIWQEGIKLYQALGDHDRVAWLFARSGRAEWNNGDTPGSLEICQEGMSVLKGAPDSPGMANLLHETARAHYFNFQVDECRALCNQALEMGKRLGAVDVQVDALITKGLLPDLPIEKALQIYNQAIELAESTELLYHASRAHNNLAVISAYKSGDLSLGIKHYRQAAEIARKMGAVSNELFCAVNTATIEIFQGKFRSAEKRIVSLQILMEEAHDPGPSELNLKNAEAALLRYQGELEEAIRKYREQRHEAKTVGDLQSLSGIDLYLGEILVEVGEEGEAEAVLLEAVELYDRIATLGGCASRSLLSMNKIQQGLFKEAYRWLHEAREKEDELGLGFIDVFYRLIAERRLAIAERHWPEAWEAFKAFMVMAEKSGMRWYRAQALQEWAEAHLARGEVGDEERARELLLESQAEFEEMGATYYAEQVQKLLESKTLTTD